ncbi:MAG: putative porin [Bacteroidales bacterium]
MKRIFNIIFFTLFGLVLKGYAQEPVPDNAPADTPAENPCIEHEDKTYSWRLTPELGLMYPAALDTAFLNFYKTDIEDSFATSYNYLGNFGSPGESRIYFDRMDRPDFMFMKAYDRFNVSPAKMQYYNTQIPFTQVAYLTGGSKPNAEDRFKATFGGNINRRIGIGAAIDYIYARGYYNFTGVNSLDWQLYGYYLGDRYQIQAYTNMANFSNQENGGISDTDYILKPENVNENLSDPRNIPTNLENAWNRVKHKDFYLTQRYNLGFDRTYMVNEDDSTEFTQFIPVTSFIHTLHLSTNYRKFIIEPNGILKEGFFENTYLNKTQTDDSLRYHSLKNTLGIALNEGFHKYAKFGLAGYATLENRKYTNMQDSTNLGFIDRSFKTSIIWVGGELTKQKGSILTYRANAKFALSGYNLGDVDISGQLQTKIPMFGDSLYIRANGYFKNTEPSYYLQHYMSNHFAWRNSFNKEKRYRANGEIFLPVSRTNIRAGVENITNLVYFDNKALPQQHGSNIQVFEASLQQNFKFGVFNWNNSVVYQKTSNKEVLPLPDLSIYSQMYLDFRIAKVLQTQLGFDCYYYTRYYSPTYQPGTQMFHTQNTAKTGNYPLMNVFANMKLKKARFFVMMYHVNKGLFGGNDYFMSPNYPTNPRVFKFGVSIDFAN